MNLGVILPHTKLYGGVKRFLELGNIFIDRGHQFFIFVVEGGAPDWFRFKGNIISVSEIENHKLDALFFTEPRYLDYVLKADSKRKIFYHVRGNENLNKLKKYPEIEFFANSTNMYELAKRKYKVESFKAFGGINISQYSPKEINKKEDSKPFVVMAYGRLTEGRKGTMYVVKACELLYKKGYDIKLLLFDTPVDEKMKKAIETFSSSLPFEFVTNHPVLKNNELFLRADLFVAPEKKAGWANTVVEAMASGIPVVATKSGTNDFLFHEETGLVVRRNRYSVARGIKRLIEDRMLRIEYAKAGRKTIEGFDWCKLANKIIEHLEN